MRQTKPVYEICKLVEQGADPNSGHRDTPLLHAVERGTLEDVRRLLACGADARLANSFGRTPLHAAASRLSGKVVDPVVLVREIFIAQGDPNAQSPNGSTPLHVACSMGHVPTVDALCQANANINILDKKRRSPLYLSIIRRSIPCCSLLLRFLALPAYDSNIDGGHAELGKNVERLNAHSNIGACVAYAVSTRQEEIAELLQAHLKKHYDHNGNRRVLKTKKVYSDAQRAEALDFIRNVRFFIVQLNDMASAIVEPALQDRFRTTLKASNELLGTFARTMQLDAEVWQDVLRHSTPRVGNQDFEFGLNTCQSAEVSFPTLESITYAISSGWRPSFAALASVQFKLCDVMNTLHHNLTSDIAQIEDQQLRCKVAVPRVREDPYSTTNVQDHTIRFPGEDSRLAREEPFDYRLAQDRRKNVDAASDSGGAAFAQMSSIFQGVYNSNHMPVPPCPSAPSVVQMPPATNPTPVHNTFQTSSVPLSASSPSVPFGQPPSVPQQFLPPTMTALAPSAPPSAAPVGSSQLTIPPPTPPAPLAPLAPAANAPTQVGNSHAPTPSQTLFPPPPAPPAPVSAPSTPAAPGAPLQLSPAMTVSVLPAPAPPAPVGNSHTTTPLALTPSAPLAPFAPTAKSPAPVGSSPTPSQALLAPPPAPPVLAVSAQAPPQAPVFNSQSTLLAATPPAPVAPATKPPAPAGNSHLPAPSQTLVPPPPAPSPPLFAPSTPAVPGGNPPSAPLQVSPPAMTAPLPPAPKPPLPVGNSQGTPLAVTPLAPVAPAATPPAPVPPLAPSSGVLAPSTQAAGVNPPPTPPPPPG